MRTYVRETAGRWKRFQRSHEAVAAELRGLVLGVCSDMSAQGRKKQVEAMLASAEFDRLRALAITHDAALGIREHTDRELALWVRTVCFCDVMKQEHAA
jgi:hypothetical protein